MVVENAIKIEFFLSSVFAFLPNERYTIQVVQKYMARLIAIYTVIHFKVAFLPDHYTCTYSDYSSMFRFVRSWLLLLR